MDLYPVCIRDRLVLILIGLHVTRPFNIYKEGQGSPKRDRKIISRARHKGGADLCDDSLMSIMRSSHKQHVGLLPDDVSRGPKLSKSLSYVVSLDFAQPLSSYYKNALASRLSPHTRTSAVTIPRQLTPTMGPAHGGVEFLKRSRPWIERLAIDWIKNSRFRRIYVIDEQSK